MEIGNCCEYLIHEYCTVQLCIIKQFVLFKNTCFYRIQTNVLQTSVDLNIQFYHVLFLYYNKTIFYLYPIIGGLYMYESPLFLLLSYSYPCLLLVISILICRLFSIYNIFLSLLWDVAASSYISVDFYSLFCNFLKYTAFSTSQNKILYLTRNIYYFSINNTRTLQQWH